MGHTDVVRRADLVERAESLSLEALEHKKQSRRLEYATYYIIIILTCVPIALYQTLMDHRLALRSLRREHEKHLEREKQLGEILSALRTGYNPNYQDMAVLEAVRGWEYFAGLPHINDVKKDESATPEELGSDDEIPVDDEDEDLLTAEQLEDSIPKLLGSDYESLLIEHEKHIGAPTDESLRK